MPITYDETQVDCYAWEFLRHALDLALEEDSKRIMRQTLYLDYSERLAGLVESRVGVIRQRIKDQLEPKECK
jgi:hypothetical protein